jgi:large subunit ribosomal protein LP0
VGASEAALLGKLGIKPFKYGLEIVKVFENGSLFDPAVLSITDEDLMASAGAAIANIAALSLAIDVPTLASIPHSVINGYKNVLAVALETGVLFPKAEKVGGAAQSKGAAGLVDHLSACPICVASQGG